MLNNAVSGYVSLTVNQVNTILKEFTYTSKSSLRDIADSIAVWKNYQTNELNEKYITVARKKYTNAEENVLIDDDANVSIMKDGAYVHAWVWISSDKLPKRKK
jgi:NAD(P)H-nitrite reductase large subunit